MGSCNPVPLCILTQAFSAFEEALKTYHKLRPATMKLKGQRGVNIPAWQIAISRAVDEMEAYTAAELAEEIEADENEPEEEPEDQ